MMKTNGLSGRIRIGQVAKRTGVSIDAIRFYERRGLLQPPPRTAGGFRLFGPAELRDLELIRTGKALGFSLGEICELVALRRRGAHTCDRVRDLVRQKIRAIEAKMAELVRLKDELDGALRRCDRELRARGRRVEEARCPALLLEAINRTR